MLLEIKVHLEGVLLTHCKYKMCIGKSDKKWGKHLERREYY